MTRIVSPTKYCKKLPSIIESYQALPSEYYKNDTYDISYTFSYFMNFAQFSASISSINTEKSSDLVILLWAHNKITKA